MDWGEDRSVTGRVELSALNHLLLDGLLLPFTDWNQAKIEGELREEWIIKATDVYSLPV
jgi:hypothetical protein